MKKLMIIIGLCFFFSVLTAQTQVEVYGRYNFIDGKITPDLNVFGTEDITKDLKFTCFALVEPTWAQARFGFSYSPVKWMKLGLSAGIEMKPSIYRIAGSLLFGDDTTSFSLSWEKGDGKDNFWYKLMFKQKLSPNFTIGAVAWRRHGEGIFFNYQFPKTTLNIWLMPLFDLETNIPRIVLGLNIKI